MYQFKRVRIFLVQIDTGDAGIINLAEELVPIRTSFVIYPGGGKQAYFVAVLEQADTEIDIFPEAHEYLSDDRSFPPFPVALQLISFIVENPSHFHRIINCSIVNDIASRINSIVWVFSLFC